MGAAAKDFCTEHYDNLEIARNLLEIYAHQVELHTAECG
jgi:hypothetical protein